MRVLVHEASAGVADRIEDIEQVARPYWSAFLRSSEIIQGIAGRADCPRPAPFAEIGDGEWVVRGGERGDFRLIIRDSAIIFIFQLAGCYFRNATRCFCRGLIFGASH